MTTTRTFIDDYVTDWIEDVPVYDYRLGHNALVGRARAEMPEGAELVSIDYYQENEDGEQICVSKWTI